IDVLQNPAHVRTQRLADIQFSLNAATRGHAPTTIQAQAPDVGHYLPGKGDGGADLPDDARDADLEGPRGERPFPGQRTEGPGGTAFDVRPAVVLASPKGIADRGRNRIADAGRQRDLLVVAGMEVTLDARLPAEGPCVSRSSQVAERQHGRVERVEDVRLQAGGEAPVVVLELGVCLKGQEAPQILDQGA